MLLSIGNSSHHLPNGIIDLFKHLKWVSWRVWNSTKLGSVWFQWRGFSVTCRFTITYTNSICTESLDVPNVSFLWYTSSDWILRMFPFRSCGTPWYSTCSHSGLVNIWHGPSKTLLVEQCVRPRMHATAYILRTTKTPWPDKPHPHLPKILLRHLLMVPPPWCPGPGHRGQNVGARSTFIQSLYWSFGVKCKRRRPHLASDSLFRNPV